MEDLAIAVGARVRAVRQERGMSVGALAQAAGIGNGSLSEIENGARNATLATLYVIADALRQPLANLLDARAGAHGPGAVEHLLVTAGRLWVGRLGQEREIGVGESAQWVSDTAHSYVALGDEPAEAVLVIGSRLDPGTERPATSAR